MAAQQIGFLHLQQPLGRRRSLQRSPSDLGERLGIGQALVSLQGLDVDVAKSSGQRIRRRMSGSIFPKRFCRFYFELCGHVLRWFEAEVGEDMLSQRAAKAVEDPIGMVSLLSCQVVAVVGPTGPDGTGPPPPGTYGGFCLRDLATGSGCRGNIYLYSETQSELDAWVSALQRAFDYFCQAPLANIGPTQAASEKPILEGNLYIRDTLEGLPLTTWTNVLVSVFDTRLECRSLTSNAMSTFLTGSSPSSSSPSSYQASGGGGNSVPCRIDRLTKDFYVGDSRVREYAFLISDFTWTIYFAAKDSLEKLFWMQSIAKVLLNLAAMAEHASRVILAKQELGINAPHQQRQQRSASDGSSDDDESEEELDRKRPLQVRHNSIKRFYGMGLPPDEESVGNGGRNNTTPPPPAKLNTSEEMERKREMTRRSIARLNKDNGEKTVMSSAAPVTKNNNQPTTTLTISLDDSPPQQQTVAPKSKPQAAVGGVTTKKTPPPPTTLAVTSGTAASPPLPKRAVQNESSAPLTTSPPVWLESALSWMRGAAKNAPTGPMTSDGFYPTTVSRLVAQWHNPQDSDVVCGILMRAKGYQLARFEGNYVSVEEEKMIFVKAL